MKPFFLIVCLILALAPAAGAEEAKTPVTASPSAERVRAETLDRLFARLKTAPDAASAKRVETNLIAVMRKSGSPTADLILQQAVAAADAGAYGVAIDMLDTLIDQRPEFVEALNQRAIIHYMQGAFDQAAADAEQVLVAEPRHFGALAGLGLIRKSQGREREALEAFRAALAVYPKMPGMAEAAAELARKLEKQI